MALWDFEPGHTAAEFCSRHMMITWVRGAFKNVQGTLEFDPNNPQDSSVEATIYAASIWTGDADRDAHLRSPDFLDAEAHPNITFKGDQVEVVGEHDFRVTGDSKIRGVTRSVTLRVRYLGQWKTPWWEDGEDKGPKVRAGFVAETEINRHDFGVSWNGELEEGGAVVGDRLLLTIDAEAILREEGGE